MTMKCSSLGLGKGIISILVLVVFAFSAPSAETLPRDLVSGLLKEFADAFNHGDAEALADLLHPEMEEGPGGVPVRLQDKEDLVKELSSEIDGAQKTQGRIVEAELGDYDPDTKQYSVFFSFELEGDTEGYIVPKTFQGSVLILDLDLD